MKRSEIINAMHSDELMTPQDIAENRPLPQLLEPENREALRKLPFDHVHNFRDLGGYLTEDGRRLRWGKLYRSDKLSALSEEDQKYLARLEVKRIVDFRSDDERTNAPHRLLKEHEVRIDPMPITVEAAQVDRVTVRLMQDDVTPADMEQYLVDANREFVANFTPVYREWLHSLLDAGIPLHRGQGSHRACRRRSVNGSGGTQRRDYERLPGDQYLHRRAYRQPAQGYFRPQELGGKPGNLTRTVPGTATVSQRRF